jgi:hypothetical protein
MNEANPLQVINGKAPAGSRLTRREMVQRLLAGVGAGTAWPPVAASHPIYAHLADGAIFEEAEKFSAADWKPLFLSAQQNETLSALSESIVSGSMKVQVNRFIDLLLSVETPKHQQNFVESLSAFETESQKRFGKNFPSLDASQKDMLLKDVSANPTDKDASEKTAGDKNAALHDNFANLKGWISGAYYSSEAGMRELGWTGEYVFESFPGCEHPEGHH